MNDPKLDLLIKEKMQKYVPSRPVQVLHCGAIVLMSIVIGVFNLSPDSGPAAVNTDAVHQGPGAGLGVYLAIAGLVLYFIWSSFRAIKARKEAHAEFLAASKKRKIITIKAI